MAVGLADHYVASLPQLRLHPTAKRIRALVDGDMVVVDSTGAWILWERRGRPTLAPGRPGTERQRLALSRTCRAAGTFMPIWAASVTRQREIRCCRSVLQFGAVTARAASR